MITHQSSEKQKMAALHIHSHCLCLNAEFFGFHWLSIISTLAYFIIKMHHKSNNSKKSTICPCKFVWSLRKTWSTREIKIACQKFSLVWSLFLSIFFLILFFAQYQICIKPVSCKRHTQLEVRKKSTLKGKQRKRTHN